MIIPRRDKAISYDMLHTAFDLVGFVNSEVNFRVPIKGGIFWSLEQQKESLLWGYLTLFMLVRTEYS
jgi:hypothetical protein